MKKIYFYKFIIFTIIIIFLVALFTVSRKETLPSSLIETMTSIYKSDEDYSSQQILNIQLNSNTYPSGYFSQSNTILKLTNYAIKASRNSAYDGKYISISMIQYVLSRGCRWLDFEVYYNLDSNNNPQCIVGYSINKNSAYPVILNSVPVPLYRVITKTIQSAMIYQSGNTYFTTNTEDPLFIHIRIKCTSENKEKMYDLINEIINQIMSQDAYSKYKCTFMNNINSNTLLNEISNKVIFVFDYDSTLVESEIYQNKILNNYLICGNGVIYNIPASQVNLDKYPSTEPPKIISNDMVSLTKIHFVETNNENAVNVDLYSAIYNYGYQIVEQKYYMNDNNLKNNELYWQNYKQGIVLMSYILNYMK